jgi:hypothetical protein
VADIIVGVNQSLLDRALAALFARQPAMFSGTQSGPGAGPVSTLGWSITAAPTVTLADATALWRTAIRAHGAPASLPANSFSVTYPSLVISLPGGGTMLSPTVIASVELAPEGNGMLVASPLGVSLDLTHASPADQAIYLHLLVPALLGQAKTMLGGSFPLPPPIGLGSDPVHLSSVKVANGALMVGAGVNPGPPDWTTLPASLPASPLFVLLSMSALDLAFEASRIPTGQTQSTSGVIGSPVEPSTAYRGSVTVVGLLPRPTPQSLPAVPAGIVFDAQGTVAAGFSSTSYDGSTEVPTQMELQMAATTLQLAVASAGPFTLKLDPNDDGAALLVGVLTPLVSRMIPTLGPFPIVQMPAVTLPNRKIVPTGLTVGNGNGMLSIVGDLTVA